jgi:pimeloyl-ACP methyl ester carboxylesterase
MIYLVRFVPLSMIRRVLLKKTSGVLPAGSAWREFHDAYFREAGRRITRRVVLDFLRNGMALRRESVFRPEVLERWNGRMLILGSRDDTVTLPALEKLKARYPAARVQLFDEGGHHTFLLYPEAYTAALSHFLSA